MKNIFRFLMAVAVLLTASCAKEDISSSIVGGGEVEMTFTVDLPELGTRAYGNGANATLLRYYVFDAANGAELEALRGTATRTSGNFTFTLPLLKGMKYNIALWADKNVGTAEAPQGFYAFDGKVVTVDYVNANDNDRDAFYHYEPNFDPTNPRTTTFTLYRPFAQLNAAVSAADMTAVGKNEVTLTTSTVTVDTYTGFDISTGDVTGNKSTVTFEATTMPCNLNPAEELKADYTYVSMNYLLVPKAGMVSNVKFTLNATKNGGAFAFTGTSYNDVPLKQNFRTNILGSLLTKPTDFTVTIDAAFGGDENYDILGRLKDVLANGGDLVLFSDVTLDEPITIPAGKEVNIDLSKYSLTIGAGITVNGALKMSNGQAKVNVEQDGNSDVYVGLNAKSGSSIDFEDVKVSVANKNAAVYTYADDVEINLTNTNMTVGENGHGVIVPQSVDNLKVNLVNSTINAVKDGYYGLYLMQTNSTVSIDENSEVNDFWVMGGNVNVVYGGEKPEVKTDGMAVTITYYTEDAWAIKDAILNGGNIEVNSDIALTEDLNIPAGKEAIIDLNGHTLTVNSSVLVEGKLSINEGEVNAQLSNHGVAFETVGSDAVVELNGVTMNVAPNTTHAILISGSNGTDPNAAATINIINSTIDAAGYGIHAPFGAKEVVINVAGSQITGSKAIFLENVKEAKVYIDDASSVQTIVAPNSALTIYYESDATLTATVVGTDATIYKNGVCVYEPTPVADANGNYSVKSEEGLATALQNIENGKSISLAEGTYVIPAAAQGKTVTFVNNGNVEDVKVGVTKVGVGGENCDYGLDGSNATFENITITTNSSTYIGYARCNGTYKNCVINGTYTLYGDSVFEDCTFNVSGDVYNIWTWGAPTATFTRCTFNCDGKAVLLYGTANTKLTVNNCTFNDNGGLTDLKAAIEIGNDYNKSYELIVNNATVNGFAINDKGISTGTTLWANKNSMPQDKLNVVVDGVDVY